MDPRWIQKESGRGRDWNEISWDRREVASRALGHVRIVVERITVDARAYVRKSCWHLDTRFLSLFALRCASPSYPPRIASLNTSRGALRAPSQPSIGTILSDPRSGIRSRIRSGIPFENKWIVFARLRRLFLVVDSLFEYSSFCCHSWSWKS